MTSNQIAYASAIEAQRHDLSTEGETNRHNVESEKLQQAANNLAAEKLAYEDRWNSERNRIQEEYNRLYLELQQTSIDNRYKIDQQINLINEEKNRINEEYNTKMAEFKAAELGLEKDRITEVNRHNEASESLEYWYDSKRLEYERQMTESNVALNAAKITDMVENREIQEMNVLSQYSIAAQKLQQELDIWNARASFMNAELISNNILGGFRTGFSIFKPFDWRF